MNPSLVPNFSWVLPGRLAGSGSPRGRPGEAHRALQVAGIRVVASLIDVPPPRKLLAAAGLSCLWFPIANEGLPDDEPAFIDFVDIVHQFIEAGDPALVHCHVGVGRCGLFLSAYLTRHASFTPEAAIAEVRRLRGASIVTASHRELLARLARRAS